VYSTLSKLNCDDVTINDKEAMSRPLCCPMPIRSLHGALSVDTI